MTRPTFFPFGGTRSSSGTLNTDKKFTGQRQDGSGLYYYNARYYDAEGIRRFISPDWVTPDYKNPQDLNPYTYCLNNPLKYVDPSGHAGEESVMVYLAFSWLLTVGANLLNRALMKLATNPTFGSYFVEKYPALVLWLRMQMIPRGGPGIGDYLAGAGKLWNSLKNWYKRNYR